MGFAGQNIVVGYDDTTAAMAAVRWAAELARSTGSALQLVHAWTWPLLGQGVSGLPVIDPAGPRNQAARLLDDAAERVAAEFPDLEVGAELLTGMPREALEEISGRTDLLVVGTRGLGAVLGALLGSVSRGILHDAGCPVAVIRSDQFRAGPVLVGYDGSAAAGEAVDEAADLAAAWGDVLRVAHVHAAARGSATGRDDPAGGSGRDERGKVRSSAQAVLEEGAARAAARHEGLEVQSRMIVSRSVAEGLLDAADGARMLVIGHRGLSRGHVGSTAHAVVLHATGNVTVVRQGSYDGPPAPRE